MLTRQETIRATGDQLALWGEKFDSLDRRRCLFEHHRSLEIGKSLAALRHQKRNLERRLEQAAGRSSASWDRSRQRLQTALRDFRTRAIRVYDEARGAS